MTGTVHSEPEENAPRLDVVELRVHGVNGGSVTELLDVPPVRRVGGDELAGFFQPRGEGDTETRPGVRREVFAWGNLTSGAPSRVLWLLLLPFLLVNLAYWMRPRRLGAGASRRHLWANHAYGVAVRLLALSLTALLVVAAAGLGMDLVAWQCAGHGTACAELRPWLGYVATPGAPLAETGTTLVLGAVVPLMVLAVLWRLSRRSGARFEAVYPDGLRAARSTAEAKEAPISQHGAPLGHSRFWRGFRLVSGLRCVHIALACCVIAALLILAPLSWDQDPAARTVGIGLVVLVGVLAGCCALLVGVTDAAWHGWADTAGRWVRNLSLLAVPVAAAYAALWPRPGWTATGVLPGLGSMTNLLFFVQAALVLGLAVLAVALYRGSRDRSHTAAHGMAGPAAALLGSLLGGVFSAAVGTQASGWLGGCHYPGAEQTGCLAFYPPVSYAWLQLTFTLVVAAALVVVPLLWLVERRRQAPAWRMVANAYPDWAEHPNRHREIMRALAHGQLTERLPAMLAMLLVPVLALVGPAVALGLGGGLASVPGDGGHATVSPQALSAHGPGWLQTSLNWLVPAGSLLGALLLAALLWLGRAAYRDKPTRQAVGVLWDIGTFWPRGAHPLAPPCYTERAVPQLACRISDLVDNGTAVVLSGYSQGSVLAAAAVWQLPEQTRDRLALLTHGAPLYRLYARYFPSYFGPGALEDLAGRVCCWRNLWRRTDPIGGPVHLRETTIPAQQALPDPPTLRRAPGEALPPPIFGHSDYPRDPAYAATVAKLVDQVLAQPEQRESAG